MGARLPKQLVEELEANESAGLLLAGDRASAMRTLERYASKGLMAERQREASITAHGILVARVSAKDAGNESLMRRKLQAYGVIP